MSPAEDTWSVTFTGKRFWYGSRMHENEVDPVDLAHHLSQINRYGGAARFPFSVAQHSINVAAGLWRDTESAICALDGLIHDAHEAYGPGDVISPCKPFLGELKPFEKAIDAHVRRMLRHYGVPLDQRAICKTYDMRSIRDETNVLLNKNADTHVDVWALPKDLQAIDAPGLTPVCDMTRWEPEYAEEMWLKLFDALTKLIRNKRLGTNLGPPRLVLVA